MTKTTVSMCYLLATVTFAVVAFAARVTTDYDRGVDFSKYKTYSWLQSKAGNSLWEDRMRRSIDSQLSARGLSRVDSSSDLSVSAFGSTHDQQSLETFYNGFGGGWGWRGLARSGMSTTTVDITKIGTLVVDLFDAASKKLLWRGKADDTMSGNPEKNEKKLEKSVKEMFKHFPPQGQS